MASRSQMIIRATSILLVAFAIRVVDIGRAPFQGDEVLWSFMAYKWGHEGDRFELGPVGTRAVNLPPFFSDMMAVPFAITPDPRLARLYVAAFHLLSMALLYAFTKRYWGSRTALWVLFVYAALPHPIWVSRYIWNLNVVAPLMIFYMFTGYGVMDGRRWSRWLHPLSFTLLVQGHPAGVVYAPISLAFYLIDLYRNRRLAWQQHSVGLALAVIATLPYLIGLIRKATTESLESTEPVMDGSSSIGRIISHVVSLPALMDTGPYSLPVPDYLQSPLPVNLWLGLGWLILISAVFYLLRGVWQPAAYREAVLGAAYVCMPLLLIILPVPSYRSYMSFIPPVGAMLLGIWMSRSVIGQIALVGVSVASVWLILDAYQQVQDYRAFDRDSMLSLNAMMEIVETANAADQEVIYLAEGASPEEYEQALTWQILSGGASRVIWGRSTTLPIPAAGVTYVGYNDARHIPELYSQRPVRHVFEGLYRVVDVPPNSRFTPTCPAQEPQLLSSGATIIGYYTPEHIFPGTNQEWRLLILWQGENPVHHNYQMFVHLVDAAGNRFAQQDVELPGTLSWRSGDQMVTEIRLPIGDALPTKPYQVWVGMYTLLPEFKNADVLDAAGNPVGQWVTIPVCTAS